MATESFGTTENTNQKTTDSVTAELYELMGFNFPITVTVEAGKVTYLSFETEWQEGTTTPQEQVQGDGSIVIEHVEDYKKLRMSEEHVAKLKKWAAANVSNNS